MRAWRYLWLIVIPLGIALASCGGSGSSGFDSLPNENAAIQQALDLHGCVEGRELTICAADTGPAPGPTASPTPTRGPNNQPTPSGTAAATPTRSGIPTPPATVPAAPTPAATVTPSATINSGVRVDTGLADATSVVCTPAAPDAPCNFVLTFAVSGFAPTAIFRIAVRADSRGRWMIGPELHSTGAPESPVFDAPVVVAASPSSAPAAASIQLAILVYQNPPAALPSEIEELADSGADFAFVTREIALQSQPLP